MEQLYSRLPKRDIAARLGRTVGAVKHRAHQLGLVAFKRPLPTLWTEEEDKVVRSLYSTRPAAEIARELPGRTPQAIRGRAQALGLSHRHWQPHEDARLRELYGTMGTRGLVQALGRSRGAVQTRILRTGVARDRAKEWVYWDKDNDQKLRDLFGTMSLDELAAAVGVPRYRIRYHLRRLGLIEKAHREWTPEEEALMRQLYPTHTLQEIADRIGCTIGAVQNRARRLGLEGTKAAKPWTPEEEATVRRQLGKRSWEEIAQSVGLTVHAVKLRVHRQDLRSKR